MTLFAKDVMVKNFESIHMNAPVEDAVQLILNSKLRKTGHKTRSLMVVDDLRRLSGVITMFGILYHFRPDFLNCWINCEDLQWEGQLKILLEKLKKKKVHQIMSPNVVGVSLNDHLMVILDRMIKNKYHRLPVLENGKLIGVVYISDIYYFLFSGKPV
ncbi:MAG: CBS domain-containing protein [Deltaproteobacteria bacterium]|nr:CBS domain-containing protein [Deltaproteobacteria bacterium]